MLVAVVCLVDVLIVLNTAIRSDMSFGFYVWVLVFCLFDYFGCRFSVGRRLLFVVLVDLVGYAVVVACVHFGVSVFVFGWLCGVGVIDF